MKHNSTELSDFFTLEADGEMIQDISHGLSLIWAQTPDYVKEIMVKIRAGGELKSVLEKSPGSVSIMREILDRVVREYPELGMKM